MVTREAIPDYPTVARVMDKELKKLYALVQKIIPVFVNTKLTQHNLNERNTDIVNIIIRDMLWNPEDVSGEMHGNMMQM